MAPKHLELRGITKLKESEFDKMIKDWAQKEIECYGDGVEKVFKELRAEYVKQIDCLHKSSEYQLAMAKASKDAHFQYAEMMEERGRKIFEKYSSPK